ncbi:serine hydrolase domain-containing protein [Qipengyuania flava]|uniref:serine hydrolase domain-containing protein n=1 Tax=Qipengyuania flava TaxID=192812 RepID=UPI001C62FD7C|nr:serine hydrolase domain-containing protein [Qipengyuania flava]QYJ08208.1 beta-lactamase family protein [Qipengyuania flava]
MNARPGRLLLCLAAPLAVAALAAPASADTPASDRVEDSPAWQMGERLRPIIKEAGFEGDLAVSTRPDSPSYNPASYSYIDLLPEPWRGDGDGLTWRWASVTKQMVAILVMQQVERGTMALDEPVATYLPDFSSANAGTVTIRQLLQHRSGLPNPDAGYEDSDEIPPFYREDFDGSRDPVTGFCAGPVTGEPGGEWTYNNCDYMVLGAVLEAVTGESWDALFKRNIAEPLELEDYGAYPGEPYTRWGFQGDEREAERDLAYYQASAGLYGGIFELVAINNALLTGKLLGEEALAEMWTGDPALGYMALGQWVFEAPLAGCDAPVRIVERRGAVGAVQVRNFILPDQNVSVAAFSQRAPFDFGEIWMGSGFSHDLLSAVVCQKGVP